MGTAIRTIQINNRRGFTMVEIICVIIIIGIVSSIALPAIDNFRASDRCKAEASILVNYIRQAKYQAMQDNCFNRIVFASSEDDDPNVFKVQTYEGNADTLRGAMSDNNNWASIADEEEVTIEAAVEVDLGDFGCKDKTIYFKPDGFIYEHNGNAGNEETIISEQRVVFKYGNSAVAVDINALGVISSEAIYLNEDEDEGYFGESEVEETDLNTDTEVDEGQ